MTKRATHLDALIDGYISPPDDAEARAQSLETLRNWMLAMETKDVALMESIMHEDILIDFPLSESGRTEPGLYREFRGLDECREFWKNAFQLEESVHPFTDLNLTVNPDGSRIFLEAKGDMVMTTGAEYRNRYAIRYDIENGKIRHFREYYNPLISAVAFGRPIAGHLMLDKL